MKIFLLGRPCLTKVTFHTTTPCIRKNEFTACLPLNCALIALIPNLGLRLLQSVDSPTPDQFRVSFGSHSELEGHFHLLILSPSLTLTCTVAAWSLLQRRISMRSLTAETFNPSGSLKKVMVLCPLNELITLLFFSALALFWWYKRAVNVADVSCVILCWQGETLLVWWFSLALGLVTEWYRNRGGMAKVGVENCCTLAFLSYKPISWKWEVEQLWGCCSCCWRTEFPLSLF